MIRVLIKTILFISFLFVGVSGNSSPSPAFRRFANGLDNETVRKMLRHRCEPEFLQKRESRGVERWTHVSLTCRDLGQNQLSTIHCDKHCLDPISCTAMKRMKLIPVYRNHTVSLANGGSTSFNLPVSCICIPSTNLSHKCIRKIEKLGH